MMTDQVLADPVVLGIFHYFFPAVGVLLMLAALGSSFFRPDASPVPPVLGSALFLAAPWWGAPFVRGVVVLAERINWPIFGTVFLAMALALALCGRLLFGWRTHAQKEERP